jgi:hypothetical protein
MRNSQFRAVLVLTLATPLGACSSFLGIHFAHHIRNTEPVLALATADVPRIKEASAAPATDAGRSQLAAGQLGLAVESFQRALASGEPISQAANGMGVVYARLGRFDLSQRFFEQAMAADPTDTRYADNLARLLRSPLFALRHDRDIAERIERVAPSPIAPPSKDASSQPPTSNLQRISRAEVHIITYPQLREGRQARMAAVGTGFTPLIRISIAGRDQPVARSFVRIALPEPKTDVMAINSMPAAIVGNRSRTQK